MFDTFVAVDRLSAEGFDAEFAAIVARASDGDPDTALDLGAAPGPELAGLVAPLVAEAAVLHDADVVDAIAAAARLEAWAASLRLSLVGELAGRREADPACFGQGLRCAGAEVAAALAVSPRAGDAQVALALDLARLPGTAAALHAGRIDLVKARVIADGVEQLGDAAARAVEDRVLDKASTQTAGRLRAAVARAAVAADPAAADKRHEQATEERRVEFTPLPDGIAELRAIGPADDLAALFTAIDALARKAKTADDGRGIDARRFDALADLARLALDAVALPTGQRARPQLQVIAPITMLLGLDDQPGELAGYGPIPASMVRRIAADAVWRRLLTDPVSGALLDYGRTTYRPPADLADFVMARDRTCRFPGCRQPAHRCDLDHGTPYPDGPTAAGNLGCQCKAHHRLKHETDWAVEQRPDGTFVWTSPSGHQYVVEPEPYFWPTEPESEDAVPDNI